MCCLRIITLCLPVYLRLRNKLSQPSHICPYIIFLICVYYFWMVDTSLIRSIQTHCTILLAEPDHFLSTSKLCLKCAVSMITHTAFYSVIIPQKIIKFPVHLHYKYVYLSQNTVLFVHHHHIYTSSARLIAISSLSSGGKPATHALEAPH